MSSENNSINTNSLNEDDNLKESHHSDERYERLNNIVSGIPGIAWESWGAPDSDIEQLNFYNNYIETLLGYTVVDWISTPKFWFELMHPDDREMVKRIATEKFAKRKDYDIEFRWLAKNGRYVWVESHVAIKYDEQGQVTGLRGITVDISKRKLIEEELNAQKSRLEHIFDHSPSFIITMRGEEMVYEMVNPAYYKIVGERELIGRRVSDVFPGIDDQAGGEIRRRVYQTGEPFTANELKAVIPKLDGSGDEIRYLNVVYFPSQEADGSISGIIIYGVDVTEQVLSRIRIQENEERYHYLFNNNPLPMWVFDMETLAFLSVNNAAIKNYGYSEEEFLGMTILNIRPPEEIPDVIKYARLDDAGVATRVRQFRHIKKDGTLINVEVRFNRIVFNGRKAKLVLVNDITERRKAETALKQAEENYRHLVESSPGIVYLNEPHPPYSPIYISPNIQTNGYTPEEYYADPHAWRNLVHPEDREWVMREFRKAADQGLESELKYRVIARDGSVHWWKDKARFVIDEQGNRTGWQGIILDITTTKALEEQLRQSQRLESVGLLAGGIAHDFNNMLTAINGYSDLTLQQMAKDDPLRQNIEEIRRAGQHSADLTQQLLAFSRQQVLQPKVSDVNDIIFDTSKMLQRLIGEDVQLTTSLNQKIGQVIVDPGQFSQIILNLAMNARDAMPQGGNLTIETANVTLDGVHAQRHIDGLSGEYVRITMSDNGTGMSEEIKQHIFEPFFTTKELGHGTGLGLATVYGIVKQSGGAIDVYSEEGLGTSFKIYLPRVAAEVDEAEEAKPTSKIRKGTEKILLVEDEELVRKLSRALLEKCGYTVIEAEDGIQALEFCQQEDCDFDLLMTDVVMPQMSGRQLAEKMRKSLPNLLVLFTSGYTDDAVVRHGVIESNTNFIQKPFTMEALSAKIRDIFDNAG